MDLISSAVATAFHNAPPDLAGRVIATRSVWRSWQTGRKSTGHL